MRPMSNVGLSIKLSPAEHTRLRLWECALGTPRQGALRCRIMLVAGAGGEPGDGAAVAQASAPARNENPKLFIWTATVEDIVQKIAGLEPSSSRSSPAPNRAHIYATPSCR